MPPQSIDDMLANLTEGEKQDSSNIDKLLALKKLEIEEKREERAANERERARAEERAGKSDLLKTLATIGAPIIASMLNKPAIDPTLMAVLAGKNNGDEFKSMMEMSRQQAAMQMETLTKSLLHIMEVKDTMNEKIMERAIEAAESGDNDSGLVGVLKQVASIAGPLMNQAQTNKPPVLPAPNADGTAAVEKQTTQKRPMDPPALVVLRTLKNLYGGTLTERQTRTAKASLVVVILQDDALVNALLSDDENALVAYCTPIVMGDKELAAWINTPATSDKKAAAEWLVDFVKDELVPRIDYEINGDAEDDADPEELNKENQG